MKKRNLKQLEAESGCIANLVRMKRKQLGYNQQTLSDRVGVGLRFLKELEQGKKSLRLDKVEQLLNFFGYTLVPERISKMSHESPA